MLFTKTDIRMERNGSVDNDLGWGNFPMGFSRKQEIFLAFLLKLLYSAFLFHSNTIGILGFRSTVAVELFPNNSIYSL